MMEEGGGGSVFWGEGSGLIWRERVNDGELVQNKKNPVLRSPEAGFSANVYINKSKSLHYDTC